MADNKVLNPGSGGATIATDDIAGIDHPRVKVEFGADGSATDVSSANPLPVVQTGTPALPTGASTAAKQPALGTAGVASADVVSVQGVASMTALKVDGSGVTQPVSGPLTDAQLRATAVPVSGTVTASGPLTDAQLRATAVPVSGTVTASGPLTDAQLRATAVPISGTVTANGAVTNAGTFAVQDSQKVVDNAAFTDGTTPVQPAGYIFDEVAGTALTENDAAAARIDAKRAQVGVLEDATTRGQRAAVSAAGALKVDGSAVTQPVSGTVTATGPLTDAQLRATAVPVSGTVTASGPLTDAQLRATAVPVSGTVTAQLAATTTGGLSKFHLVSAATANATNVKASAGKLHGWYIYNSNAAARKVAFHNTAGTPTAGAAVTDSLVIPPTSAANAFSETGITFATGIAITTVTGLADSDATAVALNDLVINLYYA